MCDVKWIKLSTSLFDDEKIQLIESLPKSDSILIIWFKLLCLAGKNNNDGVFLLNENTPYTNEMLSKIFRRKKSVVENAIKVFQEFGMVEIVDDVITIPKWGEHQNLQAFDKKKEYMKNYMQEYRSKQKSKTCKTNSKVNVNSLEEDKDKELDKEIKNIFIKPTLDEVRAYCNERQNGINPEQFVDYYESKGWLVGKTKMKDWKAAVRTWENNRKGDNVNEQPKGRTTGDTQSKSEYEREMLEAIRRWEEDDE